MNGGECFYVVVEGIVACNCTWMYGGKRCEKYMVNIDKLFKI